MKKAKDFKRPVARQLPSGSWFCRVRVNGQDVAITRDTEKEAVAEAMAVKYGIKEAEKKSNMKRKTLEEAIKEYIAARDGFLSPSTIAGYEKFKRNTFQCMMKENIFSTSDDQWQSAVRRERKLGRSPKYIKNAWMFIAAAIEEAGAKRPEVMLYPDEKNERAYLTHTEIDKFVEAVKGKSVEIPALLCLSSLRRSEMLALKWDNVDLENQVMYVRGATVRGNNGLVDKKQNKSKKSRRAVPIIPPLLEAMKQVNHEGNVVKMGGDTVLKYVKKTCAEAGITIVDLHGLRHSFASLAYHLGIPEMIAAEIGGWEDLTTMHNIYTHIAQADIAKRSQDFRDYFSKEKVKNGNENGNEI